MKALCKEIFYYGAHCRDYVVSTVYIGGGTPSWLWESDMAEDVYKRQLYARTDIGGVYRYEYEKKCWKSLIDSVSMADISETSPIACALDEKKPERLYIMSGIKDVYKRQYRHSFRIR